MSKIKKITSEEANKIIDTREPHGSFWCEDNGIFIGIDNNNGNAWTEEFIEYNKMIYWLGGRPTLHRFENVDIVETLRKITEHNTECYQTDFEYDVAKLKAAVSPFKGGQSFLWMSRKNGTWCFDERDVYIHNTDAYQTWRYYNASYDGVLAYRIELEKAGDTTKVIGNICELDYEQHKKDIEKHLFTASSVEVSFSNPNNFNIFDPVEYRYNIHAISERYGQIEKAYYAVNNEYDLQSTIRNLAKEYWENTDSINPDDYIRELTNERFNRVGYTKGDMEFINFNDMHLAVKNGLTLYALSETNEIPIKTQDDLMKIISYDSVIGIKKTDKEILNYLTSPPAGKLFNHDELSTLFSLSLSAGKNSDCNKGDLKTLQSVTEKLDKVLSTASLRKETELINEQEDIAVGEVLP